MRQDKPRCAWAKSPLMQAYHDTEWGVPTRDDGRLYEMLLLEAFQAGLSWQVILSKRENFRRAFDGFDPHKIAAYGEDKVGELLKDAGIVRCRRKIEAAVINARCFLEIQRQVRQLRKLPVQLYRRPGAAHRWRSAYNLAA